MGNNENNTKEVKSRAIKGEPALVHPCASQWRVSRVAVWQRFFEKRSCARWRISMILRVTGAIEERFRTALTIYRADTRINRQRCLFSYEMFAIPSSHETAAFTTSERASEQQARCALVESERRLNRLPVHFCFWASLPREEGFPSAPFRHTYT